MNKKTALINLSICLIGGGIFSYFTELKWLAGALFIFSALFINGSIAVYEDARPGGFENPDATDTPAFARGMSAVRYWVAATGVSALAVIAGACVQFFL
jgi:hypothetical protein